MPKSDVVLTVQREHGVKDLALHLSCTLRGAAHPKPLVQTHGSDDGIAGVRRLLPLGQGGGGDDADPTAQSQEITQELETRVGHPDLLLTASHSFTCYAFGSDCSVFLSLKTLCRQPVSFD